MPKTKSLNTTVDLITDNEGLSEEKRFLAWAKKAFAEAHEYEYSITENRKNAEASLEALRGGRHQWSENVLERRDVDKRPVLTVNRLKNPVNAILGEMSAIDVEIKVTPQTRASAEIAEVYDGLIKNIQIVSDFEGVADTVKACAVRNGFGYVRITSDYLDEDSFDKELRIERISNPFTVYSDPKRQDPTGRDCRYRFISQFVDRDQFKEYFPNKEPESWEAGSDDAEWVTQNAVRIAEVWVKKPFKKELYGLSDGRTVSVEEWEKIKDEVAEMAAAQGIEAPTVDRKRTIDSYTIIQYIIDGSQVLDGPRQGDEETGEIIYDFKTVDDIKKDDGTVWRKHIWPGKSIPIGEMRGESLTLSDGSTVLTGAIHHSIDAQKIYNFSRSSVAEQIEARRVPKVILTPSMIENHTDTWKSQSLLPYHLVNDPLPNSPAIWPFFPPSQTTPVADINETAISGEEIKETSGVYSASLGAPSNETSGRAILARIRQTSTAVTSAYQKSFKALVRFLGEELVAAIPHFYDTERIVTVLNNKDEEVPVLINHKIRDDETGEEVVINDLTQGKFRITVRAGQTYATKSLELAEVLTPLAGSMRDEVLSPILVAEIFRSMDFPRAQKIAEKIEAAIVNRQGATEKEVVQ